MAFTALPMALIGQLRMARWTWFESYELLTSTALLLAPTGQLGMAIWVWFETFELMVSTAMLMVLIGQLQMAIWTWRSEEHTSELQSLMRISYAVFCLKKKNNI